MGKLVIGNWKMNPRTEEEALELAKRVVNQLAEVELRQPADRVKVGIAPPFVFLEEVSKIVDGKQVLLGAQNLFWEDKGAYTGEVSAEELKSVGVQFVIIGHSEQRGMGETDKEINKKVRKAIKEDLKVILCVGEPKEMRDKGINAAKRFVSGELEKDLEGTDTILRKSPGNLIIAYEPLWAISSEEDSEPATPEKVIEILSFIRKFLEVNSIAGPGETKILYGGSVNSENAGEFLGRDEVDGVLVGGSSLDSDEFVKIIEFAIIK